MENATKALLIAAAVLIAILIISLGVVIYQKASESMSNMDMTEYQITQFNDKFKKYEGTSKNGSEVNAMLDTVFNHNNAQDDTSTCVKVVIGSNTVIEASNTLASSPDKVVIGNKYGIKCTYNTKTGLISEITVTEK